MRLEIGKKYLCKKDVMMIYEDGQFAFWAYYKGNVYKCEKEHCLTDEDGDLNHKWDGRSLKKYFEEYTEEKQAEMNKTFERYISFETAKLLNNSDYNKYFWPNKDDIFEENCYPCVTQSSVMCWLREVHKIAVLPTLFYHKLNGHEFHNWGLDIINLTDYSHLVDYTQTFPSDSYEEAVETGIKYCLENLI